MKKKKKKKKKERKTRQRKKKKKKNVVENYTNMCGILKKLSYAPLTFNSTFIGVLAPTAEFWTIQGMYFIFLLRDIFILLINKSVMEVQE